MLVFCSIEANCIPVEEFIPFGSSAGDVTPNTTESTIPSTWRTQDFTGGRLWDCMSELTETINV